jgi:hypothetical protein
MRSPRQTRGGAGPKAVRPALISPRVSTARPIYQLLVTLEESRALVLTSKMPFKSQFRRDKLRFCNPPPVLFDHYLKTQSYLSA